MYDVPLHLVDPNGFLGERANWARTHYPRILPNGWSRVETPRSRTGTVAPGWWWLHQSGLAVCGGGRLVDGKRWLHVSMSRKDRMPSYDDMTVVKRLFIGPGLRAVQVFAPEAEHVNMHPFCLHLWACLDGDGLPDFRAPGGGL